MMNISRAMLLLVLLARFTAKCLFAINVSAKCLQWCNYGAAVGERLIAATTPRGLDSIIILIGTMMMARLEIGMMWRPQIRFC